jgi:riboflavin synthase
MKNEQNSSIEIIPSAPMYPELHQIKHLDPTYPIDTILVLFTLLTSINNLLKYIKKILKQRKCDSVKAIGQMGGDELDRDDEDKDE